MIKNILFVIIIFFCTSANALVVSDFKHPTPVSIRNIEFTDAEGYIHSLNEYRGKVVLLNFWATWCVPCVQEMPALNELQRSLVGEDVVILPVSLDYKGVAAVDNFYRKYGIEFPIYMDLKAKSFKKLELRALPTTIVINKDGNEVARILGEIEWNSIESMNYFTGLARE